MLKWILFILVLNGSAGAAPAPEIPADLDKASEEGEGGDAVATEALEDAILAVRAYDAGRFDESIALLQKAALAGPGRGHVLYNLGNAYYRAGRRGAAVAAWLGAAQLLPRDPDIKANLVMAMKKNKDKLQAELPLPFWSRPFFWAGAFNHRELLWSAAVLIFLACLVWSVTLLVRRPGLPGAVAGGALLLAGLFIGGGWLARDAVSPPFGAVTVAETGVFSGPGAGNAEVFRLHEGAPVNFIRTNGDWNLIGISDGKRGWISTRHMLVFTRGVHPDFAG